MCWDGSWAWLYSPYPGDGGLGSQEHGWPDGAAGKGQGGRDRVAGARVAGATEAGATEAGTGWEG